MAHSSHRNHAHQQVPDTLQQRVAELEAELLASRQELARLRVEHEQYRRIADFALDLERVFSTIRVAVAFMDCDFNFLRVNQAYASADDRDPAFFVGKNHFELYPHAENETIFRRVVATGETYTTYARPFVYAAHPQRGTTYWDWTLQPVFDTADHVDGLVLCLVDVTERKAAEAALRTNQQLLQTLIDHMPASIMVKDLEQRYVFVNSEFQRLMVQNMHDSIIGMTDEEALETLHDRFSPEVLHARYAMIDQWRQENSAVFETGETFIQEASLPTADGVRSYLSNKFPLYDGNGNMMGVGFIGFDITQRKHMEQLLKEQAIRDALTGLYNRRYLDETLPRELQRAGRHQQTVGVIMLDIDHFKQFNDSYGHDAGDQMLRAVGDFLRHHTRGDDIACRYGGEEFILVLPGASLEATWQRAEDIRNGLQSLAIAYHECTLKPITASLGIALYPVHHSTADGIIKAADQALYRGKRDGRNTVIGYASIES